ncbi:N-acetylmuramoyl-L-alanine amidase [Skermanella aerolata]|uniref:N-acetylmuramoyl-L-alanine amidase n=1 Tax=Skermanella aerolata TaxID=393310 RepID=A0A512DJ25_9PROT|nr:N-acetylmuramoyl-L-alanine amidase [Skermanella aerolata]KJB97342.1 cell wall hydrolase [Skermanella aerolata KACC 11604]GEO36487.1 N-acetylmuramoyl-L-alanine amidase [Skermanella aerolata]
MILAVFTLVAALAWPAAARPTVVDVRLGVHPDKTRFVMEVTDPVDFRVFTLPDPYRVVVDFPEMTWNDQANQSSGTAGSVLNYRYAPYRPGTMRLVLEVAGPVRVREAFMLPPRDGKQPRFVLDIEPVSAAVFASELGRTQGTHVAEQTPGSTYTLPVATGAAVVSRAVPSLPESPMDTVAVTMSPVTAAVIPPQMPPGLRSGPDDGSASSTTLTALGAVPLPPKRPGSRTDARRVVVLDPGHGGVDPGAVSVTGAFEKDLTLAMARVVRDQLTATGRYRVVMTRDSDVFLRLRDRVAKAREAGAELFISLHADSIGSSDVRGLSVYSLSENASDREAATLAARENRADALDGINLTAENDEVVNILISLAQRDTMNQSRRFANMLVDEMGRQTRLVPRPHRSAGFAVLTAPDIPSVLVELGYLSSPQDAKLLGQTEHRGRMARSILRSIDGYFAARTGISRS